MRSPWLKIGILTVQRYFLRPLPRPQHLMHSWVIWMHMRLLALSKSSGRLLESHAPRMEQLFSQKWTNTAHFYMNSTTNVSPKTFSAMCRGLVHCKSLAHFVLRGCSIDSSLDDFLHFVAVSPSVEHIELRDALDHPESWAKLYKFTSDAFQCSPPIKWNLLYGGESSFAGLTLNIPKSTVSVGKKIILWSSKPYQQEFDADNFLAQVVDRTQEAKDELCIEMYKGAQDDGFQEREARDNHSACATQAMAFLASFPCVKTLSIRSDDSGRALLQSVCDVLPSVGTGVNTLLLGSTDLADGWEIRDQVKGKILVNSFLDVVAANKSIIRIRNSRHGGWEDIAKLLPKSLLQLVPDDKQHVLRDVPLRNRALSLTDSLFPLFCQKECKSQDTKMGLTAVFVALQTHAEKFEPRTEDLNESSTK